MRELLARDEYAVSASLHSRDTDDSMIRFNESLRVSLVEVDGIPVNRGGIPYQAMDEWSARTMRFATKAFLDLNGNVEEAELADFVTAGEVVSDQEVAAKAKSVSPEHTVRLSQISSADLLE